ncbi:MAG: ABC transporter permease [Chloroflexi bacterium]|nr:ABC transporter permease [Chloroflexota bacterium]
MSAQTATSERAAEATPPIPRRPVLAPYLLMAPAGLVLGVLFVATLVIFRMSFDLWSPATGHQPGFTLENYGLLFSELYRDSLILTLRLALEATVITLALGYPVALYLVRTPNATIAKLIVFALLLPLLMNLFLQAYGWMIMLTPAGLLNRTLLGLGIVDRPVMLLFNETGVLLGLVQGGLPLAALPIASALRNIPRSVEDASATLGANRLQTLVHVVFPLSLPGVVAASLLLFAWNASAFVVPLLLGGRKVIMLALLVKDLMGALLQWPLGSAMAMMLVAATLGILVVYQRISTRYLEMSRR